MSRLLSAILLIASLASCGGRAVFTPMPGDVYHVPAPGHLYGDGMISEIENMGVTIGLLRSKDYAHLSDDELYYEFHAPDFKWTGPRRVLHSYVFVRRATS